MSTASSHEASLMKMWRRYTYIILVKVLNDTIFLIALYDAGSAFGVQTVTLEGSLIHPCIEYQAL